MGNKNTKNKIMNGLELETNKVSALVIHDKNCGIYTIFIDGINGPIISAPTLEEAKEKFTTAFRLSVAVRNFRYFTQAVKASDEIKKKLSKKILGKNNPAIEYVEKELDAVC